MWDDKYSSTEYAYGLKPNDFLQESVTFIPEQGKVLLIGDGEGRNGVWLAEQGFQVTSLDGSKVGLEKAQNLAIKKNVKIETVHADLNDYSFAHEQWDAIISIWCHTPSSLRKKIHNSIPASLKTNGTFILEAYTPDQLGRGTGGPPSEDLLVTLEELQKDFEPLEIAVGQEVERDIQEGEGHSGISASVQFVGLKK